MDRLSIRSRLFLLCTALVALTAFVGGLGAWGLARMDEAFQGTIRRDVPAVTRLLETDRNLQQALVAQRNLLFTSLASETGKQEVEAQKARVADARASWKAFLTCAPEGVAVAKRGEFEAAFSEWEKLGGEVLDVLAEDTPAARRDAIDLSVATGNAIFERARSALAALVDEHTRVAADAATAHGVEAESIRRTLWTAIIAGSIAALALGFVLARSIVKPLARSVSVLEAVSRGDFSQRIGSTSRDEVGRMGAALDDVCEGLQAMAGCADRIARGDLDVEVRVRSEADQLGLSFQRMVASLRTMADAADRIAEGDLAASVHAQDERDRLGVAFERMLRSLRGMADAADRIAGGDLGVELHPASERDRLGRAFERMLVCLRDMAASAEAIAAGDLSKDVRAQSGQDRLGAAFERMTLSLRSMAEAAERIAQGDLDAEIERQSEADRLGAAFERMTRHLREMAGAAEGIARGELSVQVVQRSPNDKLGASFTRMLASLRAMATAADAIAEGDLSAEVEPQSDADRLGVAFRRMTRGLRSMADAADRISRGELDVHVRAQSEKDKLGLAFVRMVETLQSTARAAESIAAGDLSNDVRPQSERDRLGLAFERMTITLRGMADAADRIARGDLEVEVVPQSERDRLGSAFLAMSRRLREIAASAERLAGGDLTAPIAAQGARDRLGAAFERMFADLSALVAEIRSTAEGIAVAGAEIASGNNDLSNRTQGEAAELERTQRNVDHVRARAEANAENSSRARGLASNCKRIAEQGHGLAQEAVQSMGEIRESSARVRQIVDLIDQIAARTGLLALNARIEAARAGEHGRGFVVVADEVRNLARQSADAAREVRELVTTTVERVETGSARVERTGETFKECVASFNQVDELVGAIAGASGEQSQAVTALLAAVAELQQSTHQNAGLAESNSRTGESLNAGMQRLSSLVARFRLAETTRAPRLPRERVLAGAA